MKITVSMTIEVDPANWDEAMTSPPGAEQAALDRLPPKAMQVLGVLCSGPGPWRSGEIVDQTNLSASDVSKMLARLVERQLAHRPTGVQGTYAAGPAPSATQGAVDA